MKITGFGAHDAFSFANLACPVNPTLTVVTGPNASGKTSLGRIVDVVRLALDIYSKGDGVSLETRYGQAGRAGRDHWDVYLAVTFDERDLQSIDLWLRASMQSSLTHNQDQDYRRRLGLLIEVGNAGVRELFSCGRLVVTHNPTTWNPWHVSWETDIAAGLGAEPSTLVLGLDSNQLAVQPLRGRPGAPWEVMIDWAITEAQKQAHMPTGSGAARPAGFQLPTVAQFAHHSPVTLTARWTGQEPELESVRMLMEWMKLTRTTAKAIGFADVVARLLAESVFVTANQRLPLTTEWHAGYLSEPPDLAAGAGLALALHQEKNGNSSARNKFSNTQDLFRKLTSNALTLDVTARDIALPDGQHSTILTPVVNDGAGDIPLELSGAGRGEAAHLAAVLARRWQCLLLDEPATNLSSSAQRQLMTVIGERTRAGLQTILVTHSGHLVPADTVEDLKSLLRLAREEDQTCVYRLDDRHLLGRARRLLRPVEVRDALFSDGVLLVEGATDYEVLRAWLSEADPTPQAVNILLLQVDGDGRFVAYMQLLDALGVAWAALADGPAFKLRLPKYDGAAPTDDFGQAAAYWASTHQVHTLATEFGTGDRRKQAEIERFLERKDPEAFARAAHEGGRSKVALGAAYAMEIPMPDEVSSIWAQIVQGLRGR